MRDGVATRPCGEICTNWSHKFIVFRFVFLSFLAAMTKTFAELGFPGRLIAVEGLDGSGKSTQIYLFKRWLELQGLKVFFSEWNSSDLVKSATSKGKKRELLSPSTFSLIHATDFADRYNFAALPDLTFFFKADLEISLNRILDGRPQLKYFEAGMDLHLSTDPYESFRIFQGRILEQYLAMSTEFNFMLMDANQPIEAQQSIVRGLIAAKLDLSAFVSEASQSDSGASERASRSTKPVPRTN